MSETKNFSSRHLEISYIIRSLKEIAKEFNVAMIVVSSLARGQKADDSKPILADLKESGDIEYCADVVGFLYRKRNLNDAELIIAKNRNGKNAVVDLKWNEQKICYESNLGEL
jgi:replicative DNA helicase